MVGGGVPEEVSSSVLTTGNLILSQLPLSSPSAGLSPPVSGTVASWSSGPQLALPVSTTLGRCGLCPVEFGSCLLLPTTASSPYEDAALSGAASSLSPASPPPVASGLTLGPPGMNSQSHMVFANVICCYQKEQSKRPGWTAGNLSPKLCKWATDDSAPSLTDELASEKKVPEQTIKGWEKHAPTQASEGPQAGVLSSDGARHAHRATEHRSRKRS